MRSFESRKTFFRRRRKAIIEAYEAGETAGQIAKKLGTSTSWIYKVVSQAKASAKHRAKRTMKTRSRRYWKCKGCDQYFLAADSDVEWQKFCSTTCRERSKDAEKRATENLVCSLAPKMELKEISELLQIEANDIYRILADRRE